MNSECLKKAFEAIAARMDAEKNYLIDLDARNGDGDLGISMSEGFGAARDAIRASQESDLGKLLICASKAFNEAAPSSLGTILSLGMMGMARILKGNSEADCAKVAEALQAGNAKIMEKAGSKPGEKTILDALVPGADALAAHASEDPHTAFASAAEAARAGSDNTANMRAIHGRAAYYGDKSIGLVDGGSVVGKFIYETLSQSF